MSSFQGPAYEIDRPTGRCAVTDRPLSPGEEYIAVLVEEGDALIRLDYSAEAWEDLSQRPENLFSFWKTTVPEPNQKRRTFVDDAVLMNLLRRLADADQPQRIAFRFVLMLILMRKKLLRYDRTEHRPIDDGTDASQPPTAEWWIVTPKADLSKGPLGKWSDETIEVLDPGLDDDQIKQVTDQLGEVLNAEL